MYTVSDIKSFTYLVYFNLQSYNECKLKRTLNNPTTKIGALCKRLAIGAK